MRENKDYATFTVHIIDTPYQDSNGNYRTTNLRHIVNKRTTETDRRTYYNDWYQFSGILTSMVTDGKECDIPSNLKINICIKAKQDGIPIEKLRYHLPHIKQYSNIQFKGMPQRADMSGQIHTIETTDIGNADEIYINESCINTIKTERPTKEILQQQNKYAQSRVKERARIVKPGLRFRFKRFWKNTSKSKVWTIIVSLAVITLWKFWKVIIKHVIENPTQIIGTVIIGIACSIIGGIILKKWF